jgi:pyruvate dehydrogenase E2 component (dihydrolipoamide acetyltransferase)
MLVRVIMPQGGQDIENGTVVRWAKSLGEPVKKGELLCEVETEKAVFEVESPSDGFLTKIVAQSASVVPILSVIAWVGTEAGDRVDDAPVVVPCAGGTGAAQTVPTLVTSRHVEDSLESPEKILISPRAKKLATEMGIHWQTIRGTGPRTRILEQDILEAAAQQGRASPESARSFPNTGEPGLIPLGKIGKAMFRRMLQSKREIPHFYVTVSVNMRRSLDLREQLNAIAQEGCTHSVNDLIVRACALALAQMPEINRAVHGEEALVQRKDINIGIATALDEGLVVPVLENALDIPLRDMGNKTRELTDAVRRGKQPSLAQAGLTISNLGMFGVESFQAIINPPEAAILAVGMIEMRVAAVDDHTIAIRPIMTLTLSVDHRVVDGVRAAKFIGCIKRMLEEPEALL